MKSIFHYRFMLKSNLPLDKVRHCYRYMISGSLLILKGIEVTSVHRYVPFVVWLNGYSSSKTNWSSNRRVIHWPKDPYVSRSVTCAHDIRTINNHEAREGSDGLFYEGSFHHLTSAAEGLYGKHRLRGRLTWNWKGREVHVRDLKFKWTKCKS